MSIAKQTNKDSWNGLTKINIKSASYNLEGFKKGENVLSKVELAELGNVQDKALLHLQCHFGMDTLSWARKGALVTGVDFAENAIQMANELKEELNIPAEFICSDIYDLPSKLSKKFDIVFTSYGVLMWLPDLPQWAKIVAHYLKPGGIFYIVEFHPFSYMFDENWEQLNNPYFYGKDYIKIDDQPAYADPNNSFRYTSYEWPHSMSTVINALRQAGLIIDFIHEFPFSSHNCFPNLELRAPGEYTLKNQKHNLPLMYSIKATYRPDLAEE